MVGADLKFGGEVSCFVFRAAYFLSFAHIFALQASCCFRCSLFLVCFRRWLLRPARLMRSLAFSELQQIFCMEEMVETQLLRFSLLLRLLGRILVSMMVTFIFPIVEIFDSAKSTLRLEEFPMLEAMASLPWASLMEVIHLAPIRRMHMKATANRHQARMLFFPRTQCAAIPLE